MKKPYEWILFDADETLFHFDAFAGLHRMFLHYKVDFTEKDYEEYQAVNQPLWVEYQQGLINSEQLHVRRFQAWADKLKVSPQQLNSAFLDAMADICTPIDGAVALLQQLQGKVKMGIITNGFTELQTIRLERTKLKHHFDIVVISEEVGIAKPHPGIFEHALELMGMPACDKVLMVGDNPDSDILGAINVGLHSCWINHHQKPRPAGISPNYEVRSLVELKSLLFQE
jgi:YjjG family noncanonical pyrimidine nucleotidase